MQKQSLEEENAEDGDHPFQLFIILQIQILALSLSSSPGTSYHRDTGGLARLNEEKSR